MAKTNQKFAARSLERDVYDYIRTAILAGDLEPGAPLVEAQLSEQFGISKTPVREALIRLKRDGLVDGSLHHKNRVATPTVEEIEHAFEFREWIEIEIAARAAENPTPELLGELKKSIDAATAALKDDDERAYISAISVFSDILVEANGNLYASEALERLRNTLGVIANVSRRSPSRRKRSIAEHRQILRAIKANDVEAARGATREHLRSIKADSLAALGEPDEAA